MIRDDIHPFIIIAIAARRVVHRTGGIDLIVNDDLFQMHEPVVLIDADRNPGQMKRPQGALLLDILRAFLIGQHANIDAPLLGCDQGLHCARVSQSVDGHIDIPLRMLIERDHSIQRRALRRIIHFKVGAPNHPGRYCRMQTERQDDGADRIARPDGGTGISADHSSSNNILK